MRSGLLGVWHKSTKASHSVKSFQCKNVSSLDDIENSLDGLDEVDSVEELITENKQKRIRKQPGWLQDFETYM